MDSYYSSRRNAARGDGTSSRYSADCSGQEGASRQGQQGGAYGALGEPTAAAMAAAGGPGESTNGYGSAFGPGYRTYGRTGAQLGPPKPFAPPSHPSPSTASTRSPSPAPADYATPSNGESASKPVAKVLFPTQGGVKQRVAVHVGPAQPQARHPIMPVKLGACASTAPADSASAPYRNGASRAPPPPARVPPEAGPSPSPAPPPASAPSACDFPAPPRFSSHRKNASLTPSTRSTGSFGSRYTSPPLSSPELDNHSTPATSTESYPVASAAPAGRSSYLQPHPFAPKPPASSDRAPNLSLPMPAGASPSPRPRDASQPAAKRLTLAPETMPRAGPGDRRVSEPATSAGAPPSLSNSFDFDFGSSFALSMDFAGSLGTSLASSTPSLPSSSPRSAPAEYGHGDSDDGDGDEHGEDGADDGALHKDSRRDTVTSLSDLLKRSTSRASKRSTLKADASSRSLASLARGFHNGATGDGSAADVAAARDEAASANGSHMGRIRKSVPSLLDLDLSGAGPSLASTITPGGMESDSDESAMTPGPGPIIHEPFPSPRRSNTSTLDAGSFRSAHSRDASTSSFDSNKDLPPTPTSIESFDPPSSRSSSGSSLQRGLTRLRGKSSPGGLPQHSPYGAHHASSTHLPPSANSSVTSLSTTASKASTRSRLGRFFSKVTGGSGSKTRLATPPGSSHASASALYDGDAAPDQCLPGMPGVGRRPSLSNLLGGDRRKSRDLSTVMMPMPKAMPAHPGDARDEPHLGPKPGAPARVPRKSFDMLRPMLGRQKTADGLANPGKREEAGEAKPASVAAPAATLKGRRSFDMLRGRLGAGRKSSDDLTAMGKTIGAPMSASGTSAALASATPLNLFGGQPAPSPVPVETSQAPPSTAQRSATAAPDRVAPKASSALNGSKGLPSAPSMPAAAKLTAAAPASAPGPDTAAPPPAAAKPHAEPQAKPPQRRVSAPATPRIIDAQPAKEWDELEAALNSLPHSSAAGRADKTATITTVLIPFLKSEEGFGHSFYLNQVLAERHRRILFGWLDSVMAELREAQPASRGACLEGVAGILESHFLSAAKLGAGTPAASQYRQKLVEVIKFAIDKLNDKAVYANTLGFSGRMLALAFFRIQGIGRKLLRALPTVTRMSMRRILEEVGSTSPTALAKQRYYPEHLNELCFVTLASHVRLFAPLKEADGTVLVEDGNTRVELSGNWLIRWTASDSDLPFAFYRAYHRQLVGYLPDTQGLPVHPRDLIGLPGFLFVSASFMDKCDALVHRSLRSVTTLGPNHNSFNAGESMNLAMGAKPKVLDLAHRRLVTTALDIVGGSPRAADDPDQGPADAPLRKAYYGNVLNVWIRAITKRTSMWDTRSVFLLLDLLDGLFYTVLYTAPIANAAEPSSPTLVEACLELFDLPFLRTVIRRILTTADNTVCVMRTIAFVYAQFEPLTSRPADRDALCLDMLLDPPVFEHLFLHWNSGVRGYFLRLLVWRLSRLGSGSQGRGDKSAGVVKILLAFNSRLDVIRKRHDELSPESDLMRDDEEYRMKRTTICSTRGVADAPWAIDELPRDDTSEVMSQHEAQPPESGEKPPSIGKVSSWLRVVKRLGSGGKGRRVDIPAHHVEPFRTSTESNLESDEETDEVAGADSQGAAPDGRAPVDPYSTPKRSSSRRSQASTPDSPTFFKFEFELGADIPRSDAFDTPNTTPSPSTGEPDGASSLQTPTTPSRRVSDGGAPALSPRVSTRFSKRVSLLPPAALTMLRENSEPVPAMPALPEKYAQEVNKKSAAAAAAAAAAATLAPYGVKLHPYAVRALAEYEQSLEEEHEWKEKIAEDDENESKPLGDLVPRLGVSWPISFNDNEE